jgi:hypothetical protein
MKDYLVKDLSQKKLEGTGTMGTSTWVVIITVVGGAAKRG